jgi:predicted N-acetyltransferase YhbS
MLMLVLDLLQTDPKHQGRGAGSILIRWGLDLADQLRVPAYLESSPAAHKLYVKHGFRDVGQFTMDPKWTCHANPSIYFMVRDVS